VAVVIVEERKRRERSPRGTKPWGNEALGERSPGGTKPWGNEALGDYSPRGMGEASFANNC